jgi:hypothetical protein
MNEFETWDDWFRDHDPKKKRIKTIPRNRLYSEEAWREEFGRSPSRYAHMIEHDYRDKVIYMVPSNSEIGEQCVYFGASHSRHGRVLKVVRLKERPDDTGSKDFYPDYGFKYEYEENVEHVNSIDPTSGDVAIVDEISLTTWEVNNDLVFEKLIGLKKIYAQYVRWDPKRWAVYSPYREERKYQLLKGEPYAGKVSEWIEYQREVDLIYYARNKDNQMVLKDSSILEKFKGIPESVGKAELVSFPGFL